MIQELTEVAQPVALRQDREGGGAAGLTEMAQTAAEDAAPGSQPPPCAVCSGELSGDQPAPCGHPICSSCLGDKTKGCPECEPEPAECPKLNGTHAKAEDAKTAEDTESQKDLKDSEAPETPKEDTVEGPPEEEVKNEAKEEVKEEVEEVKEEPLGPDDVVCDSCIENPCRALKSCLTCLVSYCEAHLRPHLENPKFQNHRLVEPLRDIERRTCESHKWPLELFCCADACCVCQDCVAEDHRGHNTVPVVEARRGIEVRRQELLIHIPTCLSCHIAVSRQPHTDLQRPKGSRISQERC